MIETYELHTDVLVLGSGPAGFAAAYDAAKNGANVILVEQCGDVGVKSGRPAGKQYDSCNDRQDDDGKHACQPECAYADVQKCFSPSGCSA